MSKFIRLIVGAVASAALCAAAFVLPLSAGAETLEEMKRSVEAKNAEIRRLEEEAKKFRQEIASHQDRAKTLNGELARIGRMISGLKQDITLTESKIARNELEIGVLAGEIGEKARAIGTLQQGLGAVIRAYSERDEKPMFAVLAANARLSDFLQQFDQFAALETRMLDSIGELRRLRQELGAKKAEAEEKQVELEDLQQELRERKRIQDDEKRNRATLLVATKNQEKKYQELLREYEAKRKALGEEIRDIEEKIRVTIDPSLLPSKGRGVLAPPVPKPILGTCARTLKDDPDTNCLTQYFGYTSFAAAGGYNGNGHNGIDFRAEIGTPVFAAEGGIVAGTGDTDIGCRRASYGKWILIRHPNNLTTLYAHLSGVGVSAGQQVARGDRIGYSGVSGYATGPHLHFSVFATQGVRIENLRSRVCGTTMSVPISAVNGYLNPLDYL